MKKVSAVIDLDSLAFFVAYNQFIKLGNTGDSEKVKNHVRDFVSNILSSVEATEYMLFYQKKGHKNFRHGVVDDYKANRGESPEFIVHWQDTIRETFEELGAVGLSIIESDDALSIVQKSYDNNSGLLVLCHNDKDIIANCPGTHYNFKTKEFRVVTKEEACLLYHQQLLTGDSTDNIMGCGQRVTKVYGPKSKKAGEEYKSREGIGPKAALKLLQGNDYKQVVFDSYKAEFGDCWLERLRETKQLIGMLSPGQTYEKFDIKFISNDGLLSTDDLFDNDSSKENSNLLNELFDD